MKKQTLLLTLLTVLIATPSRSQSIADSEGTLTVTPSFVSAYMFRGVRYGGFSFQPAIEYSKGPLDLGLAFNFPISDKIPGTCDPEIDFTASYTWTVVPDVFTITPGASLYTYPRAKKDDGFYKATFEPSVSFGYSIDDLKFSLNLYYDTVMEGPTYEFGIEYSIPLRQLDTEIELSALIGRYDWDDSVAGWPIKINNKGDYFQAGVSIPYEFSKKSKLIAGWYYTKGTNNYFRFGNDPKESNPDAIGRGVFSLSFSHSF